MNLNFIKNKVNILYSIFNKKKFNSSIDYWEYRAKQHGKRSVLNLGHSLEQINFVTENQKKVIFPILTKYLTGKEKLILDFGCGPGRFTHELANTIDGFAVGVDPIQSLLDLAPQNNNVEYKLMTKGVIPADTESFDVVWICLVLGGIIGNDELTQASSEINRVLKKNGLLILVENTADQKDGEYWKFRTKDMYQQLFSFIELTHETDYYDLEERISIMTGRKCV